MPTFEITTPDGKTFEVTGPEGSTAEQALAKVKASYSAPKPPETSQKAPAQMTNAQAIDEIVKMAHPMSWVSKLMDKGGQALDKAAYNVGGKVTDIASGFGVSPEVAAGAGYAANVATQAVPMVLGGSMAKAASPMIESVAKNVMQSALKPSIKSLQSGKAAAAVQTLLDEGINVTPGGVAKLRGMIGDLNTEIATAIKNSPATVDKSAVYAPVKQALDDFAKSVNPQSDLNAIKQAWQNFVNHPLYPSNSIPVQAAQELKQGTYKALSKKYGQLGGAEVEAEKAIARGLKEQIAQKVPEVAALNERESKLINALGLAERRALISMNNNPAGLALLADSPAKMAAFMADKSDMFKSLAARMIYASREQIPATAARLGIAGAEALNNQ